MSSRNPTQLLFQLVRWRSYILQHWFIVLLLLGPLPVATKTLTCAVVAKILSVIHFICERSEGFSSLVYTTSLRWLT